MDKQSCLVIAGEKSGEDHAMTFLPELMQLTPDCKYYGVGGDRLKDKKMEILYHLKEFSGIGISEVLGKLPFYFKAMDQILAEVKKRKTKTAILIDFQGFNLKLAKKLKKLNVNVLYYVAPQAWVWKPWRAKVLERNVHTLFTILPFEKKWFQDRGVSRIQGVVHPLMIEHANKIPHVRTRSASDFKNRSIKVLLLPGSRNVEVSRLLPIFVRGIEILKEEGIGIELGLVTAESVKSEHYEVSQEIENTWTSDQLFEACQWADMCVAASGTVTLATGLFSLPTVVCYQVSLVTEFLFGLFLPYTGPASLTNIVHEEYVFPEHLQYKADRYNVAKSLRGWIQNPGEYDNIIKKLKTTPDKLSGDDINVPDYMAQVIKS